MFITGRHLTKRGKRFSVETPRDGFRRCAMSFTLVEPCERGSQSVAASAFYLESMKIDGVTRDGVIETAH